MNHMERGVIKERKKEKVKMLQTTKDIVLYVVVHLFWGYQQLTSRINKLYLMVPKYKNSAAKNLNMLKRNYKVLSLSEKISILGGKEKKLHVKAAKIYGKNESSVNLISLLEQPG